MKAKILLGLVFVLILAASAEARLKAEYEFTDLAGKTYTPATLKGRPVVIYVGSTF